MRLSSWGGERAKWGVIALAALVLITSTAACAESGSKEQAEDNKAASVPTPVPESDEHFTRLNWDLLNSDPDAYKGASVDVVGQIFLPPERDEGSVYFQMYADPKNSEWNTIVSYADGSLRVKEDDFVRVRGTVVGKFEGENAFGAALTVPVVTADSIRIVDATAAASPAVRTLPRRQIAQAGITITVQKVDFAEDETRVFLAVKNGSRSQFNLYSSSGKAVQRGRQFESTYSSGDYPELSSEILPGVFTSGVIVFPPMGPNAGLEIHLEGYSEDSSVGDYGSLTWSFRW
jgi:hypothetical protein